MPSPSPWHFGNFLPIEHPPVLMDTCLLPGFWTHRWFTCPAGPLCPAYRSWSGPSQQSCELELSALRCWAISRRAPLASSSVLGGWAHQLCCSWTHWCCPHESGSTAACHFGHRFLGQSPKSSWQEKCRPKGSVVGMGGVFYVPGWRKRTGGWGWGGGSVPVGGEEGPWSQEPGGFWSIGFSSLLLLIEL